MLFSGPLEGIRKVVQWVRDPMDFMERSYQRHGDWFELRLPGLPLVMTSSPTAIKDILNDDGDVFRAPPANKPMRPYFGDFSLMLIEGDAHKRHRRLMTPAFHGARMHAYGRFIRAATERISDRWPTGTVFALHPFVEEIIVDSLLHGILGFEEGPRLELMRKLVSEMLDAITRPAAFLFVDDRGAVRLQKLVTGLGRLTPVGSFQRNMARVRAMLLEDIELVREGRGVADSVLAMLVGARDEGGRALDDEELLAEVFTLLAAGSHTTAIAISSGIYELLRNRSVLGRLRDELAGSLPSGFEPKKVFELPYLDAVVKETLRLHPSTPVFGRYVARPTTVAGHALPAGVVVALSLYLLHRRPDVWDHPTRFDPDRFLDKKATYAELLPFGAGSRRCIGMAFAIYAMKMVVAEVVRRVDLDVAPGYTGKTVRRGFVFGLDRGLPVICRRRHAS